MSTTEQTPRKSRLRRWLRWPLRLGAAALLLFGLIYAFPNQTLNPAVRGLGPWFADRFGWELEIGALRGAPWTRWEIEDLALRSKAESGPFAIEHLGELHLSLHGIPLGIPTVSDVREVWLRDAEIQVVAGGGQNKQPQSDTGTSSFPWEPANWPRLDVADVALRVELKDRGVLLLPNLRLGMQAPKSDRKASSRTLQLRTEKTVWEPIEGPARPVDLQVDLALEPDHIEFVKALVESGNAQIQAEGVWPMAASAQAGSEFSLRWRDLSYGEWKDFNGQAQAVWKDGELQLPELEASLGSLATLHGEGLALPWQGGPQWKAMRGSIIAGGPHLGNALAPLIASPQPGLERFRVNASMEEGSLRIESALVTWRAASGPGPFELKAQGHIDPWAAGAPHFDLVGTLALPAGEWTGQEEVHMRWPDSQSDWELRGTLTEGSGFARMAEVSVEVTPKDQPAYTAFGSLDAKLESGALSLTNLSLDCKQGTKNLGRIQASGKVGTISSWKADPQSVPLEWQADADCPELFPLADWVGSIRRIDGNAKAHFVGRGTLSTMKWRGDGKIEAKSLRLNQGESWSDLVATLKVDDSEQAQWDANASYGGAPVQARGSLKWSGPAPEFQAQVTAQGAPVLRTTDARLRADCDIKIAGTPAKAAVTGYAKVVYGRLRHQFDLSGKLLTLLEDREKGRANTSEPVTMQWPFPKGWTADIDLLTDEPIPVYSDLGKTDIALEAKIVGRSGFLYPEGSLVVGSGRVALPGSTLTWKQGVILFPKGGGMPRVEFAGETRLAGHDVTLAVRGELLNPTLEISSVPYRPQYDLLVLLMTGTLPGGNDLSRATQSLSVYLAKDLLRRWLGSEPSEEEGLLDRLEIMTGREVSESGLGTLEAMFRITGDTSETGKALWITAERDRYEDMNFGLRWVLRPKK